MSDAATPDERWLPVVGWEGRYEVSDQGRVKTTAGVTVYVTGRRDRRRERVLTPIVRGNQRPTVCLGRHGERRRVDELVLEAWVGECPSARRVVRHFDGQRRNTALTNLAWSTPADEESLLGTPERWLPVLDAEGLYEVSDHGRVRSVDRVVPHPWCPGRTQSLTGRVLRQTTNGNGYKLVSIGHERRERVHHLVLEAFVTRRPTGSLARHLNGDPGDNRPINLAWGTSAENSADTIAHGHSGRQERCQRGHPMMQPNLRPGLLRRGFKGCRACWRAHRKCAEALRYRHVVLDIQVESDAMYQKILREAGVAA